MMKLLNHKNLLIVVLGLFLVLGLVLWIESDSDLKDFGLNFFTEILGVVVTVFIIDRLAQIREYERLRPLKLAEFEDAKNLFNRFISFWYVTFSRSVPEEYPETFDEFLSDSGIGKIFNYLNVDSKPSQTDSISWVQWVQNNHKEWVEICNRFLERHSANADPELYKLIHAFIECPFMKTIPMMSAFKSIRERNDSPGLNSLSVYLPKPRKSDYEVLQKMNMCLKSLSKKYYPDKSNSNNITNYKPVRLENRKVDCALSKEDHLKVDKHSKKQDPDMR